jgi:predicted metal-binding membrane protein
MAANQSAIPLRGSPTIVLMLALCLGAWSTLATAVVTGNEALIDHEAAASADGLSGAVLFIGGWALMVGAVMVPTTSQVVAVFDRVTHDRHHRSALGAAVIGGYAATWLAVGSLAYVLDQALHTLDDTTGALSEPDWALPSVALALAGTFQFSAFKARCLTRCRAPIAFVTTRWSGQAPLQDALRIGVGHGLFCIGCCWALMVAMTALGGLGAVWMLGLGSAMVAEKTVSWGDRITRPVGAACFALAAATAMS